MQKGRGSEVRSYEYTKLIHSTCAVETYKQALLGKLDIHSEVLQRDRPHSKVI